MNEILNVTSALNYGLVSKIVPNNMESNAKEICKKMSTLSSQVSVLILPINCRLLTQTMCLIK